MRNYSLVVKLDRLDLSKYTFLKDDPKTVILKEAEPARTPAHTPARTPVRIPVHDSVQIARRGFCGDCSQSFDIIFEQKCKEHVAPYKQLLQYEAKRNEELSKELKEVDQKWYDEMKEWSQLASNLDRQQDTFNELMNKNFQLRIRALNFIASTIAPEHNYAKH